MAVQKLVRESTPFTLFEKYEYGRKRKFRFDVNALADFEQETGMGFGQLMHRRAIFATARAMLWSGLKHEDRSLTIERVGELISLFLRDEELPRESRNINEVLTPAIAAAVEQGALGVQTAADDEAAEGEDKEQAQLEGVVVEPPTPETTS